MTTSINSSRLPKTPQELAEMIDQTLLKPELTEAEVGAWAETQLPLQFATYCIHSRFLPLVKKILDKASTTTKPIAVIGFPLGTPSGTAKLREAEEAVEWGAQELDVVIPLGLARAHEWKTIQNELVPLCRLKSPDTKKLIPVKLILETHFLDAGQKQEIAKRALEWEIAFLKTSSGFTGGGATLSDIALLRQYSDPRIKIKASGGVRDLEFALALIAAGADRIGTSNGGALVESFRDQLRTPGWSPGLAANNFSSKNKSSGTTSGTY